MIADEDTRTSNKGGVLIHHPNSAMSDEQRAVEMWSVHPLDLEALGFGRDRKAFYLAHIEAAFEQHCKCAQRSEEMTEWQPMKTAPEGWSIIVAFEHKKERLVAAGFMSSGLFCPYGQIHTRQNDELLGWQYMPEPPEHVIE